MNSKEKILNNSQHFSASDESSLKETFNKKSLKLRANNVTVNQETNLKEINRENSKICINNNCAYNSIYYTNQIQNEIEKLKYLRKNYGKDWLLSTSNIKDNRKEKDLMYIDESNNNSEKYNIQKNCAENSEFIKLDASIETFIVYRSITHLVGEQDKNHSDFLTTDSIFELTLLSINNRFLIEMDETNSKIICLKEFTNLSYINIIKSEQNCKQNLKHR